MSDDANERIREKTIQIVSLNQKIEALQAQIESSQRRAAQSGGRIVALEAEVKKRQEENALLGAELAKAKAALESFGREIQGIRAERTQEMSQKKPISQDTWFKEDLARAELTIENLRKDLKRFSEAATRLINGEEGSLEALGKVLQEVGDPKYRMLSVVLGRKSVRLDELASSVVMSVGEARVLVDELQAAGEIEVRDDGTVIPGGKYRHLEVPLEKWSNLEPIEVFEGLEEFVSLTDDQDTIARALEASVGILEQKLARGGALIFQMRRAAEQWRKQQSSTEDLRYTIREWASRAQALI